MPLKTIDFKLGYCTNGHICVCGIGHYCRMIQKVHEVAHLALRRGLKDAQGFGY